MSSYEKRLFTNEKTFFTNYMYDSLHNRLGLYYTVFVYASFENRSNNSKLGTCKEISFSG